MKAADKKFLFELLSTPSPTGFETPGQRVWAKFMRRHADEVDSLALINPTSVSMEHKSAHALT